MAFATAFGILPFSRDPSEVHAEEASPKATLGDAKKEASDEAARAGEHAENLKESVKKDTAAAGKAVKSGFKSGFSILKEGIRSLGRGEGVKVEKTPREEQNPHDP